MTQEDKQLLLKDLCARLPYGVKVEINFTGGKKVKVLSGYADIINQDICVGCSWMPISDNIKPYLRPMSSMTEEEISELKWLNEKCDTMPTFEYVPVENYRIYDWMNRHHFDYRGLIEKGLALEAPEGMYNLEKE